MHFHFEFLTTPKLTISTFPPPGTQLQLPTQLPTSPTTSHSYRMAVFRKYYDELTGTIGNVSENCFTDFAGKLFANFIIIMNQKSSATKKGLVPGAQELIDAVITYVTGIEQEEKDRTRKVLEIMETVEWLRDIVHRMRESWYSCN